MGQLVGGIAGAVVGSFFGAPQLGFAIGSAIGGALGPKPPAPAVGSLAPTEVEYGWGAPIIEGTRRAATWRLWQSDLEAVDERVETKGSSSRTVGYRYRCNMGLLICRRGVAATVRIWRNKEMVATFRTDATDEAIAASVASIHWQLATFYAGGDAQLPHPVYEAALGDVPAYVGWATLWIDGAWCEGRTPPAIEVEVTTGPEAASSIVMWQLAIGSANGAPGATAYGSNPQAVTVGRISRWIYQQFGVTTESIHQSQGEAVAAGEAEAPNIMSGPGFDPIYSGGAILTGLTSASGTRRWSYDVPVTLLQTSGPGTGQITYGTYKFDVVNEESLITFDPEPWAASAQVATAAHYLPNGSGGQLCYGSSDVAIAPIADYETGTLTIRVSATLAYVMGGAFQAAKFAQRGGLFFGANGQIVRRFAVNNAVHTHEFNLGSDVAGVATDGSTLWVLSGGTITPLSAADLSAAGSTFATPGSGPRIFCNSVGDLYCYALDVLYRREGAAWVEVLDVSGTLFSSGAMVQPPGYEGGVLYAIQTGPSSDTYIGVMSLDTTAPAGVALNTILSRYMQGCGVAASQLELTETAGIQVPGYTAQGSGKYVVDELSTAYNFNLVNDGRYLRTRLRGQAAVATIEYADLGVGVDQAEAEPLEADTDSAVEVPRRVSVSAANVDSDHQVETQTDDRLVGPNVQTDSISLALSETPDRIKGIANTIAADRKTGANTGRFAVGLDWIELELGDVVNVVGRQGETRRVRLVRETFADWVRQFEWALDRVADIQTSGIVTASGSAPTLTLQSLGSAEALPLDSPLERDADNTPGQYVAVDLRGGAGLAGVYHARTEAGAFEAVGSVSVEAKLGTLLTPLRSWNGRHGWDAYSTFDVLMADGATLTGSTKSAMHADLSINNLLIGSTARGWERARFVNASLIATDTYRVSVMLRAQKGTETLAYSHPPGERIVVLARDGFLSESLDLSQVGTHWWKAVAPGRNVSTTLAVSSPYTSVRTKPLSPNRLRAVRDAAGNLTLTWSPRTRFGTHWGSAVFPNSELTHNYRVEVFAVGVGAALVRTQPVSTAEFAYSAADQAADGVLDPARVAFRITTLGPSGQAGYPLESVI